MPELAEGALEGYRVCAQRRVVRVLAAAQLLSGLGSGATLAIGSLLAVQFGGSDAWAGSVTTVLTLSAALAALPLSGVAARRGRRTALVAGLLSAMTGSGLVVLSTVWSSLAVLLAGAALLGVGTAVNLQSRFAAVDLAQDAHRGRDLSLVVWSVTVGAVAGPNLIHPGAALGAALGLPGAAGPFVISVAGMGVAAVLLAIGLRPDPLLEARRLAGADDGDLPPHAVAAASRSGSLRDGVRAIQSSPSALLAVVGVVVAHAVMVSVMAMTPLHLSEVASAHAGLHRDHLSTDSFAIIGFTISLHIAGMYALSPLMGWLADRWGRRRVLALGQVLLIGGVAVAGVGQADPGFVTVGLVLLGLGWSGSTIAGSALLAESVHGHGRVLAQGVSDTAMGFAGAFGGGTAGLVMAGIGYGGLAAVTAALSAAVLASIAFMRPRPAIA